MYGDSKNKDWVLPIECEEEYCIVDLSSLRGRLPLEGQVHRVGSSHQKNNLHVNEFFSLFLISCIVSDF